MTKEEKAKIGKNSTTLPFMNDSMGRMRELRNGGIKAVKRIQGRKEELEKFQHTLQVLSQHAKVVFQAEVDKKNVEKVNLFAAKARREETLRRQAERKAKELQREADVWKERAGVVGESDSTEGTGEAGSTEGTDSAKGE